MYAAYQLHVWLKNREIGRVYLVQRSRLTGDWLHETESRLDFIALLPGTAKISPLTVIFMAEKLYSRAACW